MLVDESQITETSVVDKQITTERRTEARKLSELVKLIFFTPFSRKLRYLYTGLSTRSDVFILGNHKEEKFRYGDPEQSLGFVHLKPGSIHNTICNWFNTLDVNTQRYEVIDLIATGSFLNKCKWDMSKISTTRNLQNQLVLGLDTGETEIVSDVIETYFMFEKIRNLTNTYIEALLDKTTPVYTYPFRGDDTARVYKLLIPFEIKNNPTIKKHFRVIITRGVDWLTVKDLPPTTEPNSVALRFWSPTDTSSVYYYMHVYESNTLILAETRCNFFLLPRITTE